MATDEQSPDVEFITPHIPEQLKHLPQWVLWRRQPRRDGTISKPPCIEKGGKLINRKKEHPLYPFETAVELATKHRCGIGIFFEPTLSPLCGIDLDHCLDSDRKPNTQAQAVLDAVGNSYVEISPSGNGLHVLIFDSDTTPLPNKRKGNIEMYRDGRFFTVTGNTFGAPANIKDSRGLLVRLCQQFLAPKSNTQTMLKVADSTWPADISPLFEKILKSNQADKFMRLHNGYTAEYKSHSEARLAYFSILAFWTRKDPDLMRLAFSCSQLSLAPSVDDRKINIDINKAIDSCNEVYTDTPTQTTRRHSARGVDTSDYGIADAIVHSTVGNQLRYHPDFGSFMLYNPPVWRILNKDAEVRFFLARYRQTLDPTVDADILANLTSEKKIPKVISALRNFPELIVGVDELNRLPMLLNCKNGVVDLTNGTLLSHSPEHLWTKCADFTFDPDATSDVWELFITSTIPNDQTRLALQIFLGYCLTGSVEEEKALFIHGSGGNGKGTLLGTVTALLGDYAAPFKIDAVLQGKRSEAQAATPEFTKLEHARLAYAEEIPPDRKLDVAQFKLLTGGDRLPIRRLHHEATQIKRPSHKMIFSGNRLPTLDDPRDQGILRRLLVVEFRNSFNDKNRDPALKKKLLHEDVKSAIFNWLLDGCLQWQQRKAQAEGGSGLLTSEDMKQDRQAYLVDNDELMYFIDDNCVRDPETFVKRSELLKRIKTDVDSLRQTSDQELTKLLLSIDGITYARKKQGMSFCGIRLRDPSELEGLSTDE